MDRDIAELVDYQTVVLNTEQVIVNGMMHVIEHKATALLCPNCRSTIINFQDMPEVYIRQTLNRDAAHLYEQASYCPHCGQKLRYESEVIEGELTYESMGM